MILDNPGHQLPLLLAVGPALEVLGEENPEAHDVSVVTAGPEWVAHPATHKVVSSGGERGPGPCEAHVYQRPPPADVLQHLPEDCRNSST